MAGKGKKALYTKLYDEQLRLLQKAGASGNETRAYAMLARFHGVDGHPTWCSVNARDAAERIGMDRTTFSCALASLTKKTFTTPSGATVPVLVRIKRGYSGTCTVYADNLFAACVALDEGQLTHSPTEAGKEQPTSCPKAHEKGPKGQQIDANSTVNRRQMGSNVTAPNKDNNTAGAGALRTPDPADVLEEADGDHTAEVSRRALELIRGGLDPREALRIIGGEG